MPDPEKDEAQVTGEVGGEGGSPGDVEIDRRQEQVTGSEAGESWQPVRGLNEHPTAVD